MRPALPAYRRERWGTPDGDFIDVDWTDSTPGAPLLVLFHGLEGSSTSQYARSLLGALTPLGWQGLAVNFRGCSGESNRRPRAYHSGDHAEIDWILRRAAAQRPQAPRFAAGVSLGGNALLQWVARAPDAARVVRGAAAVSAPLDLAGAGHGLARGFNRLYTWHFLRSLRAKSLAQLERFPGLFDGAAVAQASTLHEFDDLVTAPLHGFASADDYWARASSKPDLPRIELPTLLINARNDPFLDERYLPQRGELSPAITAEFPAQGGHVGFVTGPFPGRLEWLPARLLAFFSALLPGGT